MVEVRGYCDDAFVPVKTLLQQYIEAGEELGASITVNLDGENVVDMWGGYADRDQLWEKDTITPVFSCSKTVTALAALLLVERGLLDVDANVADYWPEFAANGKEDVKVRHILSHTSGVSGWEDTVTLEEVCHVDNAAARLATQAPWWRPGSASGYHSFTMGHLVGELVRRVSGKSLGQFISQDLAAPLGADFQLGASEKDWHRVAPVIPPQLVTSSLPPEGDKIAYKMATNPPFKAELANTELWKRTEIGASTGHGNSRSLVRLLSVISLGGQVDGQHFLSPDTINLIFREQSNGADLAVGQLLRFGIGFGLTGKETCVDWLPVGRICFWGGFGGSMVIMDLDRKLTIAYAMNKMDNVGLGSDRTQAYIKAVYAVLNGS